MYEIEISEKAKRICKKYYKHKCGDDCPLRDPCKDKFIVSEENINKNTKRINELAENIDE